MKQLKALLDLVNENEDSIFKALAQDLGKSPVESYRDEVGIVKKSATYSLSCFDKWVAFKKGDLPLLLFPSKAEVIPEPLGVVLIFSSWNFPIKVALDPLIGAISTGNTVMLKPSELAPACMSFLIQAIPQYLDNKAIKVIGGGADVGERLIELRWDKIFFTGSPRVGRLIMTAAGKHLTPVTLELGGKCLAIVHNTLSNPSKAKVTAKRIIRGKWGPCTGQACIAIDYVLVEEKLASTLIVILMKCIKRFYGDNLKELNSISRIVNKHQFQRLVDLMKDPHVASFGPLLPIITVRDSQP
ncbi:aldehyde dehydrogenase family 3 member F1-like [Hibiscus syriacus]|uniref:aldehyde dehydrogenase family 3 member F1-like n=1 Tax=Hibiscus syriacus TaxID=106335 RepID=UPI001922D968|nr:aldehyde dehydrogenase family 3 member F1-like [Hibiscus syriacus]